MKPGKIVDVILKHESKEWDELLPLANDDYYSVRLADNSEDIQADFRKKIEFIYRLSVPSLTDSIIDELENDIKVVNEMKHLREKATTNYREMIAEYLKLINGLQTASPTILPKKLIKKLESIANQKENVTEAAKPEVKPKPKAVSVKSDGTVDETSKNHSEDKKEPVAHDLPRKEGEYKNVLPFTSDNNSSLIVNNTPSGEDYSDYPDEVPGEPGDDEWNYRDLMDYLNEKLINDSSGREKIKNAIDTVYAFCKLENFTTRFAQLRAMIDSGTVKWPGGFAVGEMRKMLNPDYIPNIR
jgi:hypothetical protein